ncbi:hypothetical protein [Idiomarina xiamenensis]|uniref:Uncharacterized protein n=1 Tax=Idiomarina xiamenensis 10-D-4 TaxID=740709 RepID=K2L3G6_9GAMM|nr:hypothetical protein [Idiomarina xiamenensis]EKE84415.1 hypothetical protein A10D4_05087 [Idiomarina xiamenensis 10-D-4]
MLGHLQGMQSAATTPMTRQHPGTASTRQLAPTQMALLCLLSIERMLPAYNRFALEQAASLNLAALLEQAFACFYSTEHVTDAVESSQIKQLVALKPALQSALPDEPQAYAEQARACAVALLCTIDYVDNQQPQLAQRALATLAGIVDDYQCQLGSKLAAQDKAWQQQLSERLAKSPLDALSMAELRRQNWRRRLPLQPPESANSNPR